MWIFTRYGFFSIAAAEGNANVLMVRARARKHLENLRERFPVLQPYQIIVLAARDYRFRLFVPKQIWVEVLAKISSEQTWSNVKDEVLRYSKDSLYVQVMHKVWKEMFDAGFDWEFEEEQKLLKEEQKHE